MKRRPCRLCHTGVSHRPGIAYRLLLYVVMNFLVVPLSAASPGSRAPTSVVLTVAVHAFFICLPIAWFAARAA